MTSSRGSSSGPPSSSERSVALALQGELRVACAMERCTSEWRVFGGPVEAVPPAALCELLCGWAASLWLIVDFHKLDQPRPEELPGDYLFDWLHPDVSTAMSPWVIDAGRLDLKSRQSLVNDGWGRDSMIGLLTDLSPAEMRDHLRSVSRVQEPPESQGVTGLCWPAVLSPVLRYCAGDPAAVFMQGVKAAILEVPGQPDAWQIFAPAELAQPLRKFGFQVDETHSHPDGCCH